MADTLSLSFFSAKHKNVFRVPVLQNPKQDATCASEESEKHRTRLEVEVFASFQEVQFVDVCFQPKPEFIRKTT